MLKIADLGPFAKAQCVGKPWHLRALLDTGRPPDYGQLQRLERLLSCIHDPKLWMHETVDREGRPLVRSLVAASANRVAFLLSLRHCVTPSVVKHWYGWDAEKRTPDDFVASLDLLQHHSETLLLEMLTEPVLIFPDSSPGSDALPESCTTRRVRIFVPGDGVLECGCFDHAGKVDLEDLLTTALPGASCLEVGSPRTG
jgi:hypothetical protein